jgi:competence protein ComEC
LAAGFLLGDTRDVDRPTVDEFRASGLSHLTAVSGANVALVLALVTPALRLFPVRGRAVAAVAVILLFATVTRFEPSVLRAAAMAGCALVGSFLGRPVASGRALCLAVAGLLLVDPFLVGSVGFRLSCGASAGLVLLAGPVARRLRGPRVVREAAGATLAAQVGVAPVALPVFGGLPLVSLPANVLAVPLAAPLTAYGLPAAIAGGLLAGRLPGLTALLAAPTGLLVTAVGAVASASARVPGTVDGRGALAAVAVVSVAAALHVQTRRPDATAEGSGDTDLPAERGAGPGA